MRCKLFVSRSNVNDRLMWSQCFSMPHAPAIIRLVIPIYALLEAITVRLNGHLHAKAASGHVIRDSHPCDCHHISQETIKYTCPDELLTCCPQSLWPVLIGSLRCVLTCAGRACFRTVSPRDNVMILRRYKVIYLRLTNNHVVLVKRRPSQTNWSEFVSFWIRVEVQMAVLQQSIEYHDSMIDVRFRETV